ncbi:hypothetical protein [Pelagibius sp.]|uniref:hypothetical protein n=1 Tax=Pelagibius sp. TaxID=1931238 RepID=UPI00262DC4A2|nr:hypothetical protein [Pelagibius sp.]
MIPTAYDPSGLLPEFFHRGADGFAGRRPQVPVDDAAVPARDLVALSPEAEAAQDVESVGEGVAAETESRALLGEAGGFVRKALETMRRDLGQVLKAFGFDTEAAKGFAQAFVEPVIAALKDGVNFTAELTFAAVSQVTAISGSSFSQSTSLVARSLEIEVNHDTGEVSVAMASLSFEQHIQSGGAAAATEPLMVIEPETLGDPRALVEKLLDSEVQPPAAPAHAAAPVDDAADAAEIAEEAEEAETPDALKESLAQVRERLSEEAIEFQTRLTIFAFTSYRNDNGETITKLLLDAELNLARVADPRVDASVQEEAQSLDLEA